MRPREVIIGTGGRPYVVRMGGTLSELLTRVGGELRGRTGLAVIDQTVWALHGELIRTALHRVGLPDGVEIVPPGESSKSPERYLQLCRAFQRRGLARRSVVVAIGGGVVLDLAGFAASTYLRGVGWIGIPTTLLAMADASVGGKTGIDLDGAKNVLGTFHQPEAVLVDPSFLATLPRREYAAGLAEVVKAAIIRDQVLFDEIASDPRSLLTPGERTLEVIARAVEIKAAIVAADERERGERALLNFGHTVGHALESATGFRRWLHGEAVAIGMACAAALSVEVLGLGAPEAARIERCLADLGLPVADPDTPPGSLGRWLQRDKKGAPGAPRFVLTPRIGSASFGHQIPQDIVNNTLARFIGGRP